jgi:single-strand DNA-binding protein
MSKDLNQCNFIGRLGRDPEVRYMPSGDAMVEFSIAVGGDYTDKSGNKQEETEWVNVTAFGKKAEIVGEYLHKGSKIFVTGRLKTRKWQDKEGNDRYKTGVVMDTMQMLDNKPQGGHEAPERQTTARQAKKPTSGSGFDDFEDDIPF